MMIEKKYSIENIDSLVKLLESEDEKVRTKSRKLLVTIGKMAAASLSFALENTAIYKARWEAAKALGQIGDRKSIPSLIKALDDPKSDVAWLAAEALMRFRKAAWPDLLNSLIKRGAESVLLRKGAHHVFSKQKQAGYNNLLDTLKKALESNTTESVPVAAFNMLEKMRMPLDHAS